MSTRQSRTTAEWATFTGSCAVLAVAVALIAVQSFQPRAVASPVASIRSTTQVAGQHHVEVLVRNEGDATAANVQVTAELVVDEEESTADQTIDFLAGSEEQSLTFVFAEPPGEGELTVSVSGFADP